MSMFSHQVEAAAVGKQFDVGAATVDTVLEIHLISATGSQKRAIISLLLNSKGDVLLQRAEKGDRTHCTTRGSSLKTKGLASIAAMAWCLARDLRTRPWSPGTLFSFSCSTAHFPRPGDERQPHASIVQPSHHSQTVIFGDFLLSIAFHRF